MNVYQIIKILVLDLEQKLINLLSVGIDEKLANKVIINGYTKSSFKNTPKKKLIEYVTEEEIN